MSENKAEVLLGVLRCNQVLSIDNYIEAAQRMHIEDQLELALRLALAGEAGVELVKRLGSGA